jgi:hypothetical protein
MFRFLSTRARVAALRPATSVGPRVARIYRDKRKSQRCGVYRFTDAYDITVRWL